MVTLRHGINLEHSHLLISLCEIAYSEKAELEARALGAVQAHRLSSRMGAVCLVAQINGRAVAAWRGTKSLQNVITDVRVDQVPVDGVGGAHEGFVDFEASLHNEVVEALLDVSNGGRLPIDPTGHSLGGGAANVFAARGAVQQIVRPARVAVPAACGAIL